MTDCPCSTWTLEAQNGKIVWRATDHAAWCGNQSPGRWTNSYGNSGDDWCEDCITKVCEWCRYD